MNLDRYQVVLGTLFLKQHRVILNYVGSRSFKLGDQWFPIREGEFAKPLSHRGGSAGINAQHSGRQLKEPSLEMKTATNG